MKTADEIRNIDFVKAAFGGYRQTDVEIFLDEIADDMQKLQAENKELSRKCAELQRRIEDFQGSETSLQSILMSAQKLADSIVAEAKATADKVLEKTGEQATEILSEANTTAESMKVKAEAEATRILGEAVQKSNLLISGAEEKAKNQIALFNTYKTETSEFKRDIIERYKAQLELILSLPDEAPVAEAVEEKAEVAEEVASVAVAEEEILDADDFFPEIPVVEVTEEDVVSLADIPDSEDGFVIVADEEEEEDL